MMLYIDPGTGSMLFSVLISLFALGYFAFRGVLIKLRLLFAGKKGSGKGKRIPYVFYNEGRQYWNTFKPVVEEFEKRESPLSTIHRPKTTLCLTGAGSMLRASS